MDREASLNACNFKTKPPDNEWSTSYDRALQNTTFVKKMMRAPLHVGLFRKVPAETKSISLLTTYYKQIYTPFRT